MEVGIKTRDEILEELNEYGFSVIENYWDRETCESAIDELNSLPTHVFEEGQGGDLRCTRSNDYSSAARSFMEDQFIQEIADIYSSCNDADRTVAGIVRYNSDKTTDSGGGWHVDSEQDHQFKSFVYLTDVGSDNGPFTMAQGSRDIVRGLPKFSNLRISEETVRENIKDDDIVEITGEAGTLILADSTYLHRGKQIESGTRYTFTTYFYDR
mgnify:CR=1 FL=1